LGDPVTDIAEAIAKQLPVKDIYDDGVRPATREIGALGGDILKTLRLALAPFQMGAVLQDRFRTLIEGSYSRVEPENRIAPAPQILGPVLEAVRYEPEGTPVDEMFSQLLTRSVDSSRVGEAHPAFPHLIRQLSSDEAIVIKALHERTRKLIFTLEIVSPSRFDNRKIETDEFPEKLVSHPDKLEFYMEHLQALGLAHIPKTQADEPLWSPGSPRVQSGVRVFAEYTLTPVGRSLAQACLPPPE
jgi:hypothetical protein